MRYPDNLEIGSINTFILMIKGDDNRNKQTGQFPSGMINMIKFLEALYGKGLWKNMIISVSYWGYGSFDIADRRDLYQSEALLTHYWNNILNETFQLEHDVPLVFVDSYFPIQTIFEETRKEKYETELSKLWKFIIENKVIKSFRRQKRELSSQVESLNGIISKNIAESNEKFSEIELKFDNIQNENRELKQKVKISEDEIRKYKEKTEKLVIENDNSKQKIGPEKRTRLKSKIQKKIKSLRKVPKNI